MLNKGKLKSDIIDILKSLKQQEDSEANTIDAFSTGLANAIDEFIKSGTVITNGSASSQTGKVT